MMRLALVMVFLGGSVAVAAQPSYPPGLPPEALVRAALASAPRLVAARELIAQGKSRDQLLKVGPYEWELALLSQQRTDVLGVKRSEQEYQLQRPLRLPGKAMMDRKLGKFAREIGDLAFADAWHEAGRDLLARWFDWMDAVSAEKTVRQQLAELEQQESTVARRVAAGDAARIEHQLARSEVSRMRAEQIAALGRVEESVRELQADFPDIPIDAEPVPGDPVLLVSEDGQWLAQITDDNHELELANTRADEAALAARRVARNRVPDPTVGVVISNNIDDNRRVVGLRVALPIGFRTRSATSGLARSHAIVAAAEAEMTAGRVVATARIVVSNARMLYAAWQQSILALQEVEATSGAVVRGYQLGEFDLMTLMGARRSALDARRSEQSARVAALRAGALLMLDAHQLWVPRDEHEHETHNDH
jgi:outer membrane protein, heavy metal efflux system